jgi:hypothetical protein
VAVFAVSPWRALPESFFAHFKGLKIQRCAASAAAFDSNRVRVRKQFKMPVHAWGSKGHWNLIPPVAQK